MAISSNAHVSLLRLATTMFVYLWLLWWLYITNAISDAPLILPVQNHFLRLRKDVLIHSKNWNMIKTTLKKCKFLWEEVILYTGKELKENPKESSHARAWEDYSEHSSSQGHKFRKSVSGNIERQGYGKGSVTVRIFKHFQFQPQKSVLILKIST